MFQYGLEHNRSVKIRLSTVLTRSTKPLVTTRICLTSFTFKSRIETHYRALRRPCPKVLHRVQSLIAPRIRTVRAASTSIRLAPILKVENYYNYINALMRCYENPSIYVTMHYLSTFSFFSFATNILRR